MKKYIALIEFDESGANCGVVFPDFPGCISAGDNFADAVRMAHEALSFHVKGMKEDGEEIPDPSALEDIKANWENWREWKDTDFAIAFITLLPQYENRRYTISMDASLMEQIDAVTKNRSAFLAEAAKRMLMGV
jgi:predicted RNase H-like HicB family nuclease